MSSSPYKFLDAYEEDDRDRFFGRDRESQILLSDIVINGLVLLFAETGTGKTSLMRAGVIPLLRARDYATFFIRVSEDPAASLRDTVAQAGRTIDDAEPLAPQLRTVADRLGRPIVLFFDQFEEFFVYVLRRDRPRAQRFIDDVAALHRDESSRVQVVLSMREDFVGKMDVFRDAIPAIFHRDSSLRLRPFDEDQARIAITGPANACGVEFEPELVNELVTDMLTADGIDPTELQIVCDTLWDVRTDGRITAARYRELADGAGGTSAERVLGHRLEAEFERLDPAELELLAQLLPLLRTPADPRRVPTKYVRDVDGLATELHVDPDQLNGILDRLKRMRIVREGVHPNLVELTHDYLVRQLDELARRVRTIAPRKALDRGEPLKRGDIQLVLSHLDELDLSVSDMRRLLRSMLEQGRVAELEPLLARAQAAGVDPWGELWQMLDAGPPQAFRAVDVLIAIPKRKKVSELIGVALAGAEDVSRRTIEALETCRDWPGAPALLGSVLDREAVGDLARETLAGLARQGTPPVRDAAAGVLLDSATAVESDPIAALETISAVEVIERALERRELEAAAEEALGRLARSSDAGVARRAGEALLDHLEAGLHDRAGAARALAQLSQMETTRVVDMLVRTLEFDALADASLARLRQLAESSKPAVAGRAREALEVAGDRPAARPPPPTTASRPERESSRGFDPPFPFIADAFLRGEVVPFLGAASGLVGRPADQRWQVAAEYPPTLPEMATYLAERARYPYQEDAPNFLRVCEFIRLFAGSAFLYRSLRDVLEPPFAPNSLHRLLARQADLARLAGGPPPLIVTMAYDDTLERAFADEGEPLDVLTYIADGRSAGSFAWEDRSGYGSLDPNEAALGSRAPLLVKLFGGINRGDPDHDSYVATEAQLADFLVARTKPLPASVMARLRDSHLLFLGHSAREWWERIIVQRLLGERLLYASWAIADTNDELGQRFWNELDVEVFDLPLADMVANLGAAVADRS